MKTMFAFPKKMGFILLLALLGTVTAKAQSGYQLQLTSSSGYGLINNIYINPSTMAIDLTVAPGVTYVMIDFVNGPSATQAHYFCSGWGETIHIPVPFTNTFTIYPRGYGASETRSYQIITVY